jgi:hypothetical protein
MRLEDFRQVMSESMGLVDVATRPCTKGRPNWRCRLGDAFEAFGSLPQGIIGGCRGLEILKIRLYAIVFDLTEKLLKVLCGGIE